VFKTKKNSMKKIKMLFIAMVSMLILTGCQKEDVTPCNCGTIANDGIDNGCYWLEIRSDCSGNKKRFCFDQDVWLDSYVGERFCVTNETGW
jgi:hypothetical protein